MLGLLHFTEVLEGSPINVYEEKEEKMEIYYLDNSGFALFLEKSLIIFDYYRTVTDSQYKNVSGGIISREDILSRDNVYVFASHTHPDHFNPVIFKWQEIRPDIQYFLDSDIKKDSMIKKLIHAEFMKKGDVFEGGGIKVKAFGSTDIGSSFYLEAEGFKMFHAGDLNNWHWRDSSSQAYAESARKAFDMEMDVIKKSIDFVDLAFFPVDPRIGEGYDEGAVYFIETLTPKYFIPMHCRGALDALEDFRQKFLQSSTMVLIYRERGEKITI